MDTLFAFPLSKDDNLLKKFKEIHDFIYANDGLSTQQTLEEFVKILFLKIFDENNQSNLFFILPEEWSDLNSGKTSNSFSNRIIELFELTKKEFSETFDSDEKIKLSILALGFTVNKLYNISLANSSDDAKGLAFQKFLSHHEKDSNGQFFTPEPIIKFCVDFINPKPDESIIDPACGSGGFLLSAIRYLQASYKDINLKDIISNNLFGIDINKSIARIAKMKLLLEENVPANIFCNSSLDDIDVLKLSLKKQDGFDIVLTNPPFGAKINNSSLLSKFDLGYKWTSNKSFYKTSSLLQNQTVEILFIERCLQLLKNGGRMGIVLPNGNFENPSLDYLRYFIKTKAKILGIVNLPQETFIPYGTGVKTSLLFLEKSNNITNYNIFFGRIKKLGYQGNKNGTPLYKKNKLGTIIKDSKGEAVLDEDFSELIQHHNSYLAGDFQNKENCFSLNSNELNCRFDYDFYSPENRKLINNFISMNSVKLGEICEIVKIKSPKLKNQDLNIEYVELSDINTHSFEIINSTNYLVHELPSRASYEIKKGDVITAIAGNSVGTKKHATAFVTSEYDGAICTNGFRVLRNFRIDPYFLLYYLKTDYFLKQMFMYRTGAAIPNVSDTDLANILIYLPSEEAQKQISHKVKKAFELKEEAKKEFQTIEFAMS
jgi:type I restriction enzyme M protein